MRPGAAWQPQIADEVVWLSALEKCTVSGTCARNARVSTRATRTRRTTSNIQPPVESRITRAAWIGYTVLLSSEDNPS